MYREQHILTYRSKEEGKVIYGLSFKQAIWWFVGGFASMKLFTYLPPIPYLDIYGYLPHILPLLICIMFAHLKHPSTGMSLSVFVVNWFKIRRRKRKFI